MIYKLLELFTRIGPFTTNSTPHKSGITIHMTSVGNTEKKYIDIFMIYKFKYNFNHRHYAVCIPHQHVHMKMNM